MPAAEMEGEGLTCPVVSQEPGQGFSLGCTGADWVKVNFDVQVRIRRWSEEEGLSAPRQQNREEVFHHESGKVLVLGHRSLRNSRFPNLT